FRIDSERIGIWGTSSGGNTALLVGLTGDEPLYQTEEHKGHSDRVKTVIDCFGPADLLSLFEQGVPEKEADGSPSIFIRLLGDSKEEQIKRLHSMNPMEKVHASKEYPPFLLIHGDQDELVPYEQSEQMAKKLCENDVHTELIRIEGAPHEGNFWSIELLELIEDFLKRTL
ncbi:MAG: prolyl oligopeptidase family serine peptidase, partial [Vallitaleaceae bacterium]|nr:prolyl oligopeptidase family serine peptidase [Vallitaleaceae bacterium]